MIWSIGYEYNCQGSGGIIYCLADDWETANAMGWQYLREEYLDERVPDIEVRKVTLKIPAGSLLLY
jgi:hypothetical protein